MLVQKQAYAELGDDLENFINHVCRQHYRPKIPSNTPTSLAHLMEECWAPDPDSRPSFASIIERIDKIMVDIAIPDLAGRRFWKKNFVGRGVVL